MMRLEIHLDAPQGHGWLKRLIKTILWFLQTHPVLIRFKDEAGNRKELLIEIDSTSGAGAIAAKPEVDRYRRSGNG